MAWLDWCRPALRYVLAGRASHHQGRNPRRAEPEGRDPRRAADLVAADPDAHRHAADRLPRHDGSQDFRLRPARRSNESACKWSSSLKKVPGAVDVVADRLVGKPYLEYEIDREAAARYGVSIRDIQDVIEIAIGGETLTTTVERPRTLSDPRPLPARAARTLRRPGAHPRPDLDRCPRSDRASRQDDLQHRPAGDQERERPARRLRDAEHPRPRRNQRRRRRRTPAAIREANRATNSIAAGRHAEASLVVPPGYYWTWSGQFENQQRAMERLSLLVPLVLLSMFFSMYLGFGKWWLVFLVFSTSRSRSSGGFIGLLFLGQQPERRRLGRLHRPVRRRRRRQRRDADLPRRPLPREAAADPSMTFATSSSKPA